MPPSRFTRAPPTGCARPISSRLTRISWDLSRAEAAEEKGRGGFSERFRRYLRNSMLKINSNQLAEEPWTSPRGKFAGAGKRVSEALGRKPQATDLYARHPVDVAIL